MKKLFITLMLSISALGFCQDSIDDAIKAYNEQNYTKAIEIFKKLCDAKDAKACSSLGYMYRSAKGVKADDNLAKTYYKKACDAGDKESCSNVNW